MRRGMFQFKEGDRVITIAYGRNTGVITKPADSLNMVGIIWDGPFKDNFVLSERFYDGTLELIAVVNSPLYKALS